MRFFFTTFLLLLMVSSCKKEEIPPVPVSNLGEGAVKVIQDKFEETPLLIVGNVSDNYMIAFERTLPDGTLLDFSPIQRSLPIVMQDEEGNKWNIQGRAVEGSRTGQQLKTINSYIGFWFAWGTMYPGVELYDGPAYEGSFQSDNPEPGWTIPTANVFTILGYDGIPAIDIPEFETYDNGHIIDGGEYFLSDDDLVIGVTVGDKTHIYPHRILNWHEIVNDKIDNFYFSLSFCPITGTAVMWDRNLNGNLSTFGVSGLLYNGNVMPYDRITSSIWSQMKQRCVNGPLIESEMEVTQVLETTWRTWKDINKNLEVLTFNTGFNEDYSVNPYANYIADQSYLSYPVENEDDRLSYKERVLGVVINEKAKVYQFKDFVD